MLPLRSEAAGVTHIGWATSEQGALESARSVSVSGLTHLYMDLQQGTELQRLIVEMNEHDQVDAIQRYNMVPGEGTDT